MGMDEDHTRRCKKNNIVLSKHNKQKYPMLGGCPDPLEGGPGRVELLVGVLVLRVAPVDVPLHAGDHLPTRRPLGPLRGAGLGPRPPPFPGPGPWVRGGGITYRATKRRWL